MRKGQKHTEASRQKMKSNRKHPVIPWNRGVKAWNNGKEWPEETRENISKGMIAYWIERKENRKRAKTQ